MTQITMQYSLGIIISKTEILILTINYIYKTIKKTIKFLKGEQICLGQISH